MFIRSFVCLMKVGIANNIHLSHSGLSQESTYMVSLSALLT